MDSISNTSDTSSNFTKSGDVEKLLAFFRDGTHVHPSKSSKANFLDVLTSIQHVFDVNSRGDLNEKAKIIYQEIAETDHLVFILVDALGMHLINKLSDDNFLKKHCVDSLTSVFPSTTAAAITTILSGIH